jgi:hypothetical protein
MKVEFKLTIDELAQTFHQFRVGTMVGSPWGGPGQEPDKFTWSDWMRVPPVDGVLEVEIKRELD